MADRHDIFKDTSNKLAKEIQKEFRLDNSCYGFIHTRIMMAMTVAYETRTPVVQKMRGKKPVQQINTETGMIVWEFTSVSAAAESVNTHKSNITAVCRGKRKSCRGYGWRFKNPEDLKKH